MIAPITGLRPHISLTPEQLLAPDETLVIVDDDDAIREPLKIYFADRGYPVEESITAHGLKKILAAQQVALILLDINLPDADGSDLVPEIRSQFPDVAIVMLSGIADINVAMDCIRSGADDYITKPVQFNEIFHVVRKALEKRHLILENRRYQSDLELAHFRIELLHQLSLKMNSVYLSTNVLDEILKVILVGITAEEGLRFNRAFLAMFDEKEEYLQGRLSIGPNCREEATTIWSEMREKNLQFIDIVKNLPSCETADNEVSRIIQALHIPVSDSDNILIQAAQQRQSINVIRGYSPIPVPPELIKLLDTDSFVIVPLYSPGRTLGVIIADNYVTGKLIQSGHISALELLASQASLAIEHSHLYMDMQMTIGELESLNYELEKNKDLLIEAERYSALGQMSAQMVHVIRNPITSIGGVSRILARKSSDPDLQKYFDVIIKETDRLEKTMEELFDFVNNVDFHKKISHLYPVINQSLLLVQSTMKKNNISWEADLTDPDPLINMDSRQISQVFIHLFRNAIEAMLNGGKLTIKAETHDNKVNIAIRDTGHGLSEYHINKVKDPFFTTKTYGTGMGLTMVDRLVAGHGGSFSLHRLDSGLEVVVSLPAAEEDSRA